MDIPTLEDLIAQEVAAIEKCKQITKMISAYSQALDSLRLERGKYCHELREKHGITFYELAEICQISNTTVDREIKKYRKSLEEVAPAGLTLQEQLDAYNAKSADLQEP